MNFNYLIMSLFYSNLYKETAKERFVSLNVFKIVLMYLSCCCLSCCLLYVCLRDKQCMPKATHYTGDVGFKRKRLRWGWWFVMVNTGQTTAMPANMKWNIIQSIWVCNRTYSSLNPVQIIREAYVAIISELSAFLGILSSPPTERMELSAVTRHDVKNIL